VSTPAGSLGRLAQAAPRAVFVLFLPVAFLGLLLLPNEYRSWGGSGVDCDGPFLLTFAVPAAIVYALLGLVFMRRALVLRSWVSAVAVVFCALLVAGLWGNIREARVELADPDHRLVCERG
jgi:hypothetical protein